MRLLDALRFRLHALLRGRGIEREIDREMAFHIDMEAARLVGEGVPSEEARRRANVLFGGRQRFREETRDELRSRGLDDLAQDLHYAARTFRKSPAFTLTVVLTLAIGIGATTVIFSVTDHVVLRRLPYANASRLVSVEILSDRLKNVTPTWVPNAAHYLAWKRGCTACERMIAVRPTTLMLSGAGDPVVLSVLRASDDFLSTLGARAEIGRLFAAGDDQPGKERLIVISDALWRQRFGARSDIVGRTITLADAPWTVIGVLSPEFHMPRGNQVGRFLRLPDQADAVIPLALTPREQTTPGEHSYGVIALLRRGTTTETVRAQLDAISVENVAAFHDATPARSLVLPLKAQVVGTAGRPLLLLLAAVGAMLLIMCVNLANLFLARSAGRRRESAVRVALGAERGRLVRQALTETVLLSLVGGLAGLLLSQLGVRALVALAPSDLPRLDEVVIDARVLSVAVLVSIVAGLGFGLAPAFRIGSTAPGDVMKDGSRATSDGPRASRARAWLIASQVGLSAILLVAAGLFLQSFVRVLRADRGFTVERVLALDTSLPASAYKTRVLRNAFYEEVLRRIAPLPGVAAVGLTSAVPLEGESWVESIWTESSAHERDRQFDSNFRFVTPNYFSLLGVPVVGGRPFSDTDRGLSRVVLSENTARSLWPGEVAVGKRLRLGGTDSLYEVVGVVANVRTTGVEHEGSLTVYIPYWERGYAPTILVRTEGDPAAITSSVRRAIRAFAPSVPISKVRTMPQVLSEVVAQRRFELALIGLFALAALLTATVGIYGIISHSLGRRANEISIRIALGAVPRHVRALVLGEVFRPVAGGLVVGILASLLMGRVIASVLFEVRSTDAITVASVVLVLASTSALAGWIPARRASRLDPVDALRAS